VCFSQYRSTGKERDTESGNDYFGARYYASTMGRWMSPDWSAVPVGVPYASLNDPQSLNLYAYVGNNPLKQRDVDGAGGPVNSGEELPQTKEAVPRSSRFLR
jgi:RHS repeat-associated protein